jgi:hypothetical protein
VLDATGHYRPSLAERAGLKLTDLTDISKREEAIMSTWAESGIPLGEFAAKLHMGEKAVKMGEMTQAAYAKTWGSVARGSNRAFTIFSNLVRADNFDHLIKQADRIYETAKTTGRRGWGGYNALAETPFSSKVTEVEKLNPRTNDILLKSIANYINNASGRGSLGSWERSAVILNGFLFSPRLIASRLQMMNPKNYIFTNPFVRKQYLKSMIALAGTWTSLAGLAKLGGAEVSLDPDNADFGKIKIGNTRLDPAGGFQQYLVFVHRMCSGEFTSSTTGKTTVYGQEFGKQTRKDAIVQFIENKLAPAPATVAAWASASKNRPFEVGDTSLRLFTPMFLQDLSEILQDDPGLLPTTIAIPGALGFGVQTYGERGRQNRLVPESIFPRKSDWIIPSNARVR